MEKTLDTILLEIKAIVNVMEKEHSNIVQLGLLKQLKIQVVELEHDVIFHLWYDKL